MFNFRFNPYLTFSFSCSCMRAYTQRAYSYISSSHPSLCSCHDATDYTVVIDRGIFIVGFYCAWWLSITDDF